MNREHEAGIIFPEILIPEAKINLKKWAVVACDQYTSDPDYWARTMKFVGGAPSALHIIVPEAYLKERDVDERVSHAKETMGSYIEDGVLVRLPQGVVLVERETAYGTRMGLMLAIDLEKYDTDYATKPLIRATEMTVTERIPPRMKLREGAILECPHVMLLINDPQNSVIGPVYNTRDKAAKIYETPLMMDGGRITGWFVDNEEILNGITDSLLKLKSKSKDGMLFAVGDGNHSLASAKAVWDEKKEALTEQQRETHPLRFALVEVVNLFDNGISMEPIHRVLFNVEPSTALRMLVSILNEMGTEARMMYTRGTRSPLKPGIQAVYFESKMSKGRIEITKPQHDLLAVTLTKALDKLLKDMPRAEIDYIHGDDEFHSLSQEHACLGFYMETVTKEKLFDAVMKFGVLPRKFFSLGQADEKRYYYECRLLVEAKNGSPDEEQPETQVEENPSETESEIRLPEEKVEQETVQTSEQTGAAESENPSETVNATDNESDINADSDNDSKPEASDDDEDFFVEGKKPKKRKGLFGWKREK